MNIRELYRNLTNNIAYLDIKSKFLAQADGSARGFVFYDTIAYNKAFKELDELNLLPLSEEEKDILQPLLEVTYQPYQTDFALGNQIEKTAKNLFERLKGQLVLVQDQMEELFNSVGKTNTLDVKLVKIEDLEELEKIAGYLKRGFSVPVHEIGGKVTVENLEKGSVWIILGIVAATTAVIGNILRLYASLITAGAVMERKQHEAKVTEQHVRTVKLKNDFIENLISHQQTYINDIREQQAQEIVDKHMPDASREQIEYIKMSIDSISNLIEKGAQFYPPIGASEDVKSLFPDLSLRHLLGSRTKFIENGEGQEDTK